MIEGYSLPKIVERLDIHISTPFFWRHKILNALRSSLGNSQHNGIIESDETHFLESEKGHKGGIPHRYALKRGRKVENERKEKRKRGISKEQVSIVVAYDRNDNIICGDGWTRSYQSRRNRQCYRKVYCVLFIALYRQCEEL